MNGKLQPYWKPIYIEDIREFLPTIRRDFEAIKNFIRDSDNYEIVEEFTKTQRECFATERNRYESLDIAPTDYVVNKAVRIRNNDDAVSSLFQNDFQRADTPMELNADLAMRIFRIIGREIIENTENYRVNEAAPVGFTSPYYLEAEKIKDSIEQLFRDFNQPIEPNRDDWFKLASSFFRRFLFIHPFQDGNGRVSRILLSILLINYTIIPLCPFSWKTNSNSDLLKSLDEAHRFNNEDLLCCFIIQAVHDNLRSCCRYFGLDDE